MLSEFKDVFEGIGKLPWSKYHIQLKPEAEVLHLEPFFLFSKWKSLNKIK